MAKVSKRTFSLPNEQAAYIDAKVDDGASASEVVRAGLHALQERDAAVERWLRDEVVPTYDAMKADPNQGIPAKAVFAEMRARYSRRIVESSNRDIRAPDATRPERTKPYVPITRPCPQPKGCE
jgi:antitoxin ParD1/3/4